MQKTGNWRAVGPIQGTLEESAAAARRMGLNPTQMRRLSGGGQRPWGEGFEVDLPDSVVDKGYSGSWVFVGLVMGIQEKDAL